MQIYFYDKYSINKKSELIWLFLVLWILKNYIFNKNNKYESITKNKGFY